MKYLSNWHGLSETMILTLTVWLCTLFAIGLFVVPLAGLRIASVAALGLLVLLLAVCWSLCTYRLPDQSEGQRDTQRNRPALRQTQERPSEDDNSEAAQSWVLIK